MWLSIPGLIVIASLGCGGSVRVGPPVEKPKPLAPPSPELSPALLPLSWWLGNWDSESVTEHWTAAGGAIYGVSFDKAGGFDVMVIDDGDNGAPVDGVLRFIAMPNGSRAVEFRQRHITVQSAVFANDTHDYPKVITYRRDGDALGAYVSGGDKSERFGFKVSEAKPAPELEAADVAFAADTAARGIDGWVASFEDKGAMMRKGERVEGAAAIAEMMSSVLGAGKLAWAPIASGRSGDLGFTVGKATYTGATPADGWRSSYITIWHRQPDDKWRVVFDTGRVVQEP